MGTASLRDIALRNREDAPQKATPAGHLNLLYRDAAYAASQGRLRESEDLYAQAVQLALKLGLRENASFAMSLRAVRTSRTIAGESQRQSRVEALADVGHD